MTSSIFEFITSSSLHIRQLESEPHPQFSKEIYHLFLIKVLMTHNTFSEVVDFFPT